MYNSNASIWRLSDGNGMKIAIKVIEFVFFFFFFVLYKDMEK